MQMPDLEFRLQIDTIVVLRTQSVFCLLAILTHHDDGGLNGGKAGKQQVQQNERICIEYSWRRDQEVECDPRGQDKKETYHEVPAASELCNNIGNTLTQRTLSFPREFDIARYRFLTRQALYNLTFQLRKLAALTLQ